MAGNKYKADFDLVRCKYRQMGGVVRGLDIEFSNFIKKHKSWVNDLPLLMPGLLMEEQRRKSAESAREFVPAMKYFQRWINGRWWEAETGPSKEEKDDLEEKQRQRKYQEQRDLHERYLKSLSIEELQKRLKVPEWTHIRWLIQEVMDKKKT